MKICKPLTTFEQCLYFLLTAKNSCGSNLVLLKLDKRKLLNAHLLRLLLILTAMTEADIYELKQVKLIRN